MQQQCCRAVGQLVQRQRQLQWQMQQRSQGREVGLVEAEAEEVEAKVARERLEDTAWNTSFVLQVAASQQDSASTSTSQISSGDLLT